MVVQCTFSFSAKCQLKGALADRDPKITGAGVHAGDGVFFSHYQPEFFIPL